MMIRGFDGKLTNVGEGWQKLLADLEAGLALITEDYEVLQIKEKFGGLRYYYALPANLSDAQRWAFEAMVGYAESISFQTCEKCGKYGSTEGSKGWIRTLCKEHRETEAADKAAAWAKLTKEAVDDQRG